MNRFITQPKEDLYKTMSVMLETNNLAPKIDNLYKIKESLFWTGSFIFTGITASGGITPTWLGIDKFFSSVAGQVYNDTDAITHAIVQGIPAGTAFMARTCLYTVALRNSASRGWDFIEKVLKNKLGKMDMISLVFSAISLLLVSLPTSSANIMTVEAGKMDNYPVFNEIIDYLVIPVTLVASVILFQLSINDMINGILSFFKDCYHRSTPDERKQLVDIITNNMEDYVSYEVNCKKRNP